MSEIEQAETPTKDECVIAMLAHVLMIVSWFWAPLIIYLTKRDSRFVAFHALQALYWQIIMFCGWAMTFIVFFAVGFSIGWSSATTQSPPKMSPNFLLVFLLIWLGMMGGCVITLVLGILFGIKASHGEWAKYPVLGSWALRHAKVRTA